MRYYSILRPISFGTYPKYQDNKVLEIVNFDEKIYCEDISRDAWGYIEYEKIIGKKDAYNYDLISKQ